MTGALGDVDRRTRAAHELLARAGFGECTVRADGLAGEVLVVTAPAGQEEALTGAVGRRIAAEIRIIGFQYVAIDLLPDLARA